MAIVLAAALLVAGGLALWGRQLAGPALRLALAEAGWAVEVLEIRSVRPGGIEFGAVRLPGEDAPAMDALRVNWSWDLLRGRVRDVRIDGLQINATYIDGEFAIAGLKATGGPGGDGLPFRRVELRNLHLSLQVAAGSARTTGDAVMIVRPDGVLAGEATLDGSLKTAKGESISFRSVLPAWTVATQAGQPGFAVESATLTLPGQALALNRLAASFANSGTGLTFRGAAEIVHTARPALVRPVAMTVAGSLMNGQLALTGDGRALDGLLTLTLAARHDLASGRGTGRIDVAPIRFAADGLQPREIFPVADDRLRRVGGTVTAQGSAAWDKTGVRPALTLSFDGIGFEGDLGGIAALSGRLEFDDLLPPRTAGIQHLTATLLAPGLPGAPLDLRVGLQGETLRIERAALGLAGGHIGLNQVTLRRGADLEAVLEVSEVNLATGLALADVDGLSGTGSISGRIPLRVDSAGLAISGGRLLTNGPGTVKYTGTDLPAALNDLPGDGGQSVRLLRQALSDFHYDEISLGLNRNPAGDGTLLIGLKGANPAVLENHPFVVNIKVEANFDRLAAIFLGGYEAAGGLLRRAAGKP